MDPGRKKTALVTGCSKGGIGEAIAQELHRRGYHVLVSVRTRAKGAHLAEMGMDVVELEVTSVESVQAAAGVVRELTGGVLDMLVNNAGIGYSAAIVDSDLQRSKHLFDTNVFGVLAVTQACQSMLAAAGDSRIINIGSIFGEYANPFTGIYCASKAALVLMSDAMRVELAPFGITVIHVVTGGVATNIVSSSDHDLPPNSLYYPARDHLMPILENGSVNVKLITPPSDYARAVVANATKRSPEVHFWSGSGATTTWLTTRFLPRWLQDLWISTAFGFDKVRAAYLHATGKAK